MNPQSESTAEPRLDVTVYTFAWNEEFLLPLFFRHYDALFPGCRYVVYDNESSDLTSAIIEVHPRATRIIWPTQEQSDSRRLLALKNTCWKAAETQWVVVVDADEFLHWPGLVEWLLKRPEATGLQATGYDMVSRQRPYGLKWQLTDTVTRGLRNVRRDKTVLFKPAVLRETNYGSGACTIKPLTAWGRQWLTAKPRQLTLRHYCCLGFNETIARHEAITARLCRADRSRRLRRYYGQSPDEIRRELERFDELARPLE